ncbi:FkbM family methyltransferase [Defluviimonas sp. WL0050]|uniref:FkbM family methyltransferase n=1 Tax=Albidovulum litorale TaxID=2984134 RepID=A0ABT2ZLC0_9RHOB|nr:FkbM family methyltransferase [Defluviimonas sp. WL0050]MCV2871928.1 FkbM family methyltransferase [Defluviimonas sp. WL0050]
MKAFRRRAYLFFRKLLGRNTEVFAPHGVNVRIPDGIDPVFSYKLARGRPYEQSEADMVRRFLATDTNVIELGGCMGIVSALIRSVIGPKAVHIVVEADPKLRPICEANAKQGADAGKTCMVGAAIDYSGANTVMFAPGENAHNGRVGAAAGGIEVPTARLSDLVKDLPEGPFALVCDIEGAELALIDSEHDLLSRMSLIILETHPHAYPNGDKDLDRMFASIRSSGMEVVSKEQDVVCFRRV